MCLGGSSCRFETSIDSDSPLHMVERSSHVHVCEAPILDHSHMERTLQYMMPMFCCTAIAIIYVNVRARTVDSCCVGRCLIFPRFMIGSHGDGVNQVSMTRMNYSNTSFIAHIYWRDSANHSQWIDILYHPTGDHPGGYQKFNESAQDICHSKASRNRNDQWQYMKLRLTQLSHS
jgi:hypothetical protein